LEQKAYFTNTFAEVLKQYFPARGGYSSSPSEVPKQNKETKHREMIKPLEMP